MDGESGESTALKETPKNAKTRHHFQESQLCRGKYCIYSTIMLNNL